MTSSVSGKVAIVSGGASGIGAATCRALARAGARVVCADISRRRGAALVDELVGAGAVARYLHLDAGDSASWHQLVTETHNAFGTLDILVNAAYSARAGDIDTISEADWHETFRVTLHGVFLGMRAAIPVMGPGAAIVNVASTAAYVPPPNNIAYAAAKAAVLSVSKSAAVRLGRTGRGIRVNVVAPGATETAALAGFYKVIAARGESAEEARNASVARIPLGRIAEPDNIASAILYLVSDEASYVTGAELLVDGGLVAGRG